MRQIISLLPPPATRITLRPKLDSPWSAPRLPPGKNLFLRRLFPAANCLPPKGPKLIYGLVAVLVYNCRGQEGNAVYRRYQSGIVIMEDEIAMLPHVFSSWFSSSRGRNQAKTSPVHRGAGRQPGRRVLRVERLEDRQLLSIGAGLHPAIAGESGADAALIAPQHAAASGVSDASGPVIGGVVVSQGQITWNVTDPAGLQSSSITIDGNAVTSLYGPYTAASGVNYAAVYGALSAGAHTYTISATDNNGVTAQDTQSFTLSGPTIGAVTLFHGTIHAQTVGEITWNVSDPAGRKLEHHHRRQRADEYVHSAGRRGKRQTTARSTGR